MKIKCFRRILRSNAPGGDMIVQNWYDLGHRGDIAKVLVQSQFHKMRRKTLKVLMHIFWKTFSCPAQKAKGISRQKIKKHISITHKALKVALNTLTNSGLVDQLQNGKSFLYSVSPYIYSL